MLFDALHAFRMAMLAHGKRQLREAHALLDFAAVQGRPITVSLLGGFEVESEPGYTDAFYPLFAPPVEVVVLAEEVNVERGNSTSLLRYLYDLEPEWDLETVDPRVGAIFRPGVWIPAGVYFKDGRVEREGLEIHSLSPTEPVLQSMLGGPLRDLLSAVAAPILRGAHAWVSLRAVEACEEAASALDRRDDAREALGLAGRALSAAPDDREAWLCGAAWAASAAASEDLQPWMGEREDLLGLWARSLVGALEAADWDRDAADRFVASEIEKRLRAFGIRSERR